MLRLKCLAVKRKKKSQFAKWTCWKTHFTSILLWPGRNPFPSGTAPQLVINLVPRPSAFSTCKWDSSTIITGYILSNYIFSLSHCCKIKMLAISNSHPPKVRAVVVRHFKILHWRGTSLNCGWTKDLRHQLPLAQVIPATEEYSTIKLPASTAVSHSSRLLGVAVFAATNKLTTKPLHHRT